MEANKKFFAYAVILPIKEKKKSRLWIATNRFDTFLAILWIFFVLKDEKRKKSF